MKTITLEHYLDEKRKELEKLRSEVNLLSSVRVPLRVEADEDSFQLYSEDYSLAQDFKIFRRSERIGGTNGYDGGYSTDRLDRYPQFYFNLKNKKRILPVYIQHEGFDKDFRIVIKSVTRTEACKDYSDMQGSRENYVDLDKVFEFFRARGVKETLLEKLGRRIKEAGEI